MTLRIPHILIAISPLVTIAHAQEGWNLVWEDQFEGSALDTSNWSHQTGTGTAFGLPAGWGNNELQYYTNFPENLSVSNGTLKITARQQPFAGASYTSARIRTLNKRETRYGRIEARMKIPSTTGVWPAFWMLPTDSPYGSWAASGEIDIMESVNQADRIFGTLHYGSNWPNNISNGPRLQDGRDFSQDFHTYRVDWDPDTITWYVDDLAYGSLPSSSWFSSAAPGNPRAPFDTEYHILLNVAVGGDFPGNPNGSSNFPQTMEVDFVRIYERVQTPFGGDAHIIPGLVQAEDFDIGAQGISYNDCDATNNGGAYRDTGVDIQAASEGGHNIGWICQGEWLEYTLDVQSAGLYTLQARVASQNAGGVFRIERDGVDLTGPVGFASTGDWQAWQSVFASLELQAGEQILRFVNIANPNQEYNLNSLEFTRQGTASCNAADVAEPFGELNFFDVSAYLTAFNAQRPEADLNNDGLFNFFDASEFLLRFNIGCP